VEHDAPRLARLAGSGEEASSSLLLPTAKHAISLGRRAGGMAGRLQQHGAYLWATSHVWGLMSGGWTEGGHSVAAMAEDEGRTWWRM